MMKHTKKITILHSNDMHGDFLAEQLDDKLVGGVSMLSGYVEKVRSEEKNVLYASVLQEVRELLEAYDVGSWNGFKGSNRMALDGESFGFYVESPMALRSRRMGRIRSRRIIRKCTVPCGI